MGSPRFSIKKSIPHAKLACKRAAEFGHAKARCDLAQFYIDKKHGGKCRKGEADIEKAIQLMELAGEEGYSKAYYKLGNIYKNGQYGCEKHLHDAMMHYSKGIAKNDLDSWYGLGLCWRELEDDHMSDADEKYQAYKGAHKCFETAGLQGHTKAQEEMSYMHMKSGPANPKFFTAGICWAQMALNSGSEWAKDYLQSEENKKHWTNLCFSCYALAKGGENRFHKCSKCKIAHYCSKQCQNDHWHKYGHKDFCGKNKICAHYQRNE